MKHSYFVLVIVAALSIAACAGNQSVTTGDAGVKVPEEAVQFTTEELTAMVSGMTHIWEPPAASGTGGAYYSPDGMLQTHWDGDYNEGTWTAENGVLCWHVEAWGDEPCETYYHIGDSVKMKYRGELMEPFPLVEGNAVQDMM